MHIVPVYLFLQYLPYAMIEFDQWLLDQLYLTLHILGDRRDYKMLVVRETN